VLLSKKQCKGTPFLLVGKVKRTKTAHQSIECAQIRSFVQQILGRFFDFIGNNP
jgi:hypothetical protein